MSKEIQDRLLGVICNEMIPEYKISLELKEELKAVFLDYVENDYLTEKDKELINKYPSLVSTCNTIPIIYYYYYGSKDRDIEVIGFKGYGYSYGKDDLILNFDHQVPKVVSTVFELAGNKEAWKKVGPIANKYINIRNIYIKKLNIAYDLVIHKNTTLAFIKKEFPELYNSYINARANNRDQK